MEKSLFKVVSCKIKNRRGEKADVVFTHKCMNCGRKVIENYPDSYPEYSYTVECGACCITDDVYLPKEENNCISIW
jgi:hypothetical protein